MKVKVRILCKKNLENLSTRGFNSICFESILDSYFSIVLVFLSKHQGFLYE